MREWGTLKICSFGCTDRSRSRRVRMLASRVDTDTAIQTCVFTMCVDVPKNRVLRSSGVSMGRTVRPARADETARTPSMRAAADDGAGPPGVGHGIAIAYAPSPCGIAWL